MEFENKLSKIIMKYMDDNKIEDFSYEDGWQLAKIIAKHTKPKSKSEMMREFTLSQSDDNQTTNN